MTDLEQLLPSLPDVSPQYLLELYAWFYVALYSQPTGSFPRPEVLAVGLSIELDAPALGQKRSESDVSALKGIQSLWSKSRVRLSTSQMIEKPRLIISDSSFCSSGTSRKSILSESLDSYTWQECLCLGNSYACDASHMFQITTEWVTGGEVLHGDLEREGCGFATQRFWNLPRVLLLPVPGG